MDMTEPLILGDEEKQSTIISSVEMKTAE